MVARRPPTRLFSSILLERMQRVVCCGTERCADWAWSRAKKSFLADVVYVEDEALQLRSDRVSCWAAVDDAAGAWWEPNAALLRAHGVMKHRWQARRCLLQHSGTNVSHRPVLSDKASERIVAVHGLELCGSRPFSRARQVGSRARAPIQFLPRDTPVTDRHRLHFGGTAWAHVVLGRCCPLALAYPGWRRTGTTPIFRNLFPPIRPSINILDQRMALVTDISTGLLTGRLDERFDGC